MTAPFRIHSDSIFKFLNNHYTIQYYRVRTNYRILQNLIFTNTEQKYMMLLPFERGMFAVSLPELRERINTAIGNVTQDMLERVWREWEYRLDICRVTRGAHIEYI